MSGEIIHFEIPAQDPKTIQKFYGAVFGWKFEEMGGRVEYWNVRGAGLGGAVMRKVGPNQMPINYVKVDDVDRQCQKIRDAGGRVQHPKQAVPGLGWFAIGIDPEGNSFGLWQDDPKAFPPE
jgi:predicted enzyme related to lactoylglutathione lyase